MLVLDQGVNKRRVDDEVRRRLAFDGHPSQYDGHIVPSEAFRFGHLRLVYRTAPRRPLARSSRRGGVSVSILNVRRLQCSSLVAVVFIASVAAPAHIRAQDTPIPSGRLVFRSSSLEFRPDGTFLVHSVLEGIGEVRATGTWKHQSGAIELAATMSSRAPSY